MMAGQTNMTATDELRRMLDERGVEWEADDTQVDSTGTIYCVTYVKEGYGRTWVYEEPPDCDLLVSYNHDLTPAQAIDATLGRGTCHAVFEVDAMSEDDRIGEFVCSECGETFGGGRDRVPRYCPACGKRVVE